MGDSVYIGCLYFLKNNRQGKIYMQALKNKVFILGAGASKPAGAPLLKDFLHDGMFHLNMGSAFPDYLGNYKNFLQYLKDKYGFDIHYLTHISHESVQFFNKTNIEQVLSDIESDEGSDKNLQNVRKEALHFVFLTLENAVSYGSTNNCYPEFVKQKFELCNDVITIITFNYETLLEEELPRGQFSYGVVADKDEKFDSYEKSYKNNLLLLKLHGSSNWAVCSQCSKRYLYWSQRYDDIFKNKCDQCGAYLEAVLIPPTRSKSPHLKKLFQSCRLDKLWEMASERINLADEITIIGYSFSEYDYEATDLILNALRANLRKPRLYIADPDAELICSKIISNNSLKQSHFEKVRLFNGFKEYLSVL